MFQASLCVLRRGGPRRGPSHGRLLGYYTVETSNCVDDIRGIWYFMKSKNKKEVPYEKISSHSVDTDAVRLDF